MVIIRLYVGYCPHPVQSIIKGYIEPYYNSYPTYSEGGQYPSYMGGYIGTMGNKMETTIQGIGFRVM